MKVALVIENNGKFVPETVETVESVWGEYAKAVKHIETNFQVERKKYRHYKDDSDEGFDVWVVKSPRTDESKPHQFYIAEYEVQS